MLLILNLMISMINASKQQANYDKTIPIDPCINPCQVIISLSF